MNKYFTTPKTFSQLLKIFGFIVILTGMLSLSCSSTSANDKKAKSKKSKSVKSVEEEETTAENSNTNEVEIAANKEEKPEKSEAKSNFDQESNSKINSENKVNTIIGQSNSNTEKKKLNDKEVAKKSEAKKTAENENTSSLIWANLMTGNKGFMRGKHSIQNFVSMRKNLVAGQHPPVIILGCADSRVPPELLFDKNLGDIFVVRDAGNIADEVTLGSIEYAIEHLHSKVLIVLGHESCGAVAAAVSGEEMPSKNLQAIVDRITPAFENSKECPIGGKINLACVELNVNQSAKDLVKESAIIRKAAKEGLKIIKAVYHLETGEVIRVE